MSSYTASKSLAMRMAHTDDTDNLQHGVSYDIQIWDDEKGFNSYYYRCVPIDFLSEDGTEDQGSFVMESRRTLSGPKARVMLKPDLTMIRIVGGSFHDSRPPFSSTLFAYPSAAVR